MALRITRYELCMHEEHTYIVTFINISLKRLLGIDKLKEYLAVRFEGSGNFLNHLWAKYYQGASYNHTA